MTKSADNKRMLYGRIPINIHGKLDLDATAKILAPIFLRQFEAEQQALERRKQLHIVNEAKSN